MKFTMDSCSSPVTVWDERLVMHTLSLSLALYIYIWLLWQKRSHGCCKWSITCVTDFLTLPLCFSNSEEEVWAWRALKVLGRLSKAQENCSSSQKVLCSLEGFAFPVCRWAWRCMTAPLPTGQGFPKPREHQSVFCDLWYLQKPFPGSHLGLKGHQHRHLHGIQACCGQACQELHGYTGS